MSTQIPVKAKPIPSALHLQEDPGRAAREVGTVHAKAPRREGQMCRNFSSERSRLSGSQPNWVTAHLWHRCEKV